VRKLIARGEGYCAYLEANLLQGIDIDEQTTVKDKCGLVHAIIDSLPIDGLKLLPLGGNDHCFCSMASFERRAEDRDLPFDYSRQ